MQTAMAPYPTNQEEKMMHSILAMLQQDAILTLVINSTVWGLLINKYLKGFWLSDRTDHDENDKYSKSSPALKSGWWRTRLQYEEPEDELEEEG